MKKQYDLYRDKDRYTINHEYREILRLEKMLANAGIPFEITQFLDGWQICYPEFNERVVSVIEHMGSYGHKEDLLEIMGLLTKEEEEYDSVKGYLSADNVFSRIRYHWLEKGGKA